MNGEDLGNKISSLSTNLARWYFDVVSTSSLNESVNIVFYNAGPLGFAGVNFTPLSVEVSGSFANGTLFEYTVPATIGAVITEDGHGLTGDWQGANASFHGSNLLNRNIVYRIDINSPELDIYGKVVLHSASPSSCFS
jgi:hypothetical protein